MSVWTLVRFEPSDVSEGLDISNLKLENRVLGEGSFSTVYSGTYHNSPVAIKRLSIIFFKRPDSVREEFKEEAKSLVYIYI